jgi:single-strand DNA-binding protein
VATNTTVNRIELIGSMGAMPQMRYTAGGVCVTTFSMVTYRIWKGRDGERQKQTDWDRVTAWGGWPRSSTSTWAKASACG